MSTSLLYHGFGIRGYKYVKTDYENGGIQFTISQDRERLRCATCCSYAVNPRGAKLRTFRSLPIGATCVDIVYAVPRVECENCGELRQVSVCGPPKELYKRL